MVAYTGPSLGEYWPVPSNGRARIPVARVSTAFLRRGATPSTLDFQLGNEIRNSSGTVTVQASFTIPLSAMALMFPFDIEALAAPSVVTMRSNGI